jgi:ATP-binding cassette subfamily B protein/ATP-binding cassette subfamily C protein LapB
MTDNKNAKEDSEGNINKEPEQNLDDNLRDNETAIQYHNKLIKDCFNKILTYFNKNITDEVLYANSPIDDTLIIHTQNIIDIANKVGLIAEMRRINGVDIKHGPAILILSDQKYYALLDNEIYDPVLQEIRDFDSQDIVDKYMGYTIFFTQEDLTIGSFVKKTGFLFKSLSSFKSIFLEVLLLSFFINMFAMISPFFTMNVYDRVVPNNAYSTLMVLTIGMVFMYSFDFIFKVIKTYLSEYISNNVGGDVDMVLMDKILSAKAPGISMSAGAKTSLFKELSMVREFYFSKFIPMLVDLPFLLLFFLVLFMISPAITLVPFVASIIVFVVNIFLQVPLQNTHHKMLLEDQQKGNIMVETLSNVEGIKTFNYIGKILSKWRRALDGATRRNSIYTLWVNISSNFSVFVMNVVSVIAVVVGCYEIGANAMTTGGLIASSTIVSKIMTTVIAFSSMVVRYRSIQNTLKHLEKIVNQPTEDENTSNGKKGPFSGRIDFKNITFFYPGLNHPILNKCNFTIPAQSKVAIIGKTGAGKSTVTRLLLGLDFANQGQVLIDNYDINNVHINELRANIGFMPQKSFFFQGSIRDNIMMNSSNISPEQYKKACDVAGVDLITSLSGAGDDMLVQEGGKNLSGGQQQIMALARAILNNPPIIIMDEPTNGMDTSLEASFMERTKQFIKDKTFILITHKPAQLSLVDRVILIDKASVVIDDTKEKVIEMLNAKKNTL